MDGFRVRDNDTTIDGAPWRFDAFATASPAAIIGIDACGVVVSVNPAAEALAGVAAADLIGRHVRDVVSSRQSESVSQMVDAVLAGEGPGIAEGPLWVRGGRKVWVRAAMGVQPGPSGEAAGVAVVAFDATREHRLARKARAHERMMSRMNRQMVEAVTSERKTIASGLDNELGQTLAALKIQLSMAGSAQSEQSEAHSQRAMELVEQAIAQTRLFTYELYPPILRELGLGAAIEWLAGRIQDETGGQWTFIGSDVDLSEDRVAAMYGITRELMRNVIRHANASDVLITLTTHAGHLSVAVYDNGIGFTQRPWSEGAGLFDASMQLNRLGGSLEIDTMSGGSTVRATIPIPTNEN